MPEQLRMIELNRYEQKPEIIERRLQDILSQGALKSIVQTEGRSGPVFTLWIRPEMKANSRVKVFRESSPDRMSEAVNSYLEEAGGSFQHWTCHPMSKSPNLIGVLVYSVKTPPTQTPTPRQRPVATATPEKKEDEE